MSKQPIEENTFPAIPFSEIPEATKDFLLAASFADSKSVADVITDTLDRAARDAGFEPSPDSQDQAA